MTVQQFCTRHGIEITEKDGHLTVGGSLYLRGTGITALPDNLTVGGSIDLRGYLYLRDTGITAEDAKKVKKSVPAVLSWRDYRYIAVDRMFCEVVSRKGPVYKCHKVNETEYFYVVVIDGKAAHGKTIKEAKADLVYKIGNRDTTRYQGMKLADTLTHAEAVEMYRVVTGACAFGTKDYVEHRLPKRKAKYTIAEIIKMTAGEYGNAALVEFFNGGIHG